MRSLSGPKAPDKPADPIIVHPDVRRMLLTQRAFAEGGRAFSYWIALQIDRELSHSDESARKDAADLVALLTPIAKAFLSDNAFISTNEGMQVFGGHGYIPYGWDMGIVAVLSLFFYHWGVVSGWHTRYLDEVDSVHEETEVRDRKRGAREVPQGV